MSVDLQARLDALRAGIDPDADVPTIVEYDPRQGPPPAESVREVIRTARYEAGMYRYYRPFEAAADDVIGSASVPTEHRIYTGIPEFDAAMRGIRPGELCLVVGYAHSGKTVFATQSIFNNRHKRVVLFTMDESRPLVLMKLASLVHGVSAEEIEARIEAGDNSARELLRSTVTEHFPHLAVFDDVYSLDAMSKAVDEVSSEWGAAPQLVVTDYADLLQGAGEDVPSKMNAVKAWGKEQNLPNIVLHQSSRTKGADGAKVGLDSGGYGGEQQAIFLVGVRRKRNQYQALIEELELKLASNTKNLEAIEHQLADARYELNRNLNTITFSLVKNKRPPSRLVDDMDFYLDPSTGRVRPLGQAPSRRMSTVDDAMAARAYQRRIDGDEEPF